MASSSAARPPFSRRTYPQHTHRSLRGRRNHAFRFSSVCRSCYSFLFYFVVDASAQMGNSGSIEGVVKDPSGAAVPNATVEIKDPVSGYLRTTNTNSEGAFRFTNVPFNPYHLSVNASGFAAFARDVEVRSVVPTQNRNCPDSRNGSNNGNGRRWRRSSGKRSHLSQRLGSQQLCKVASGKCLVFREFSRYPHHPWNCRGFKRSLPRARRSRGKLVFRGQPADHRPAEQGLFQPDSLVIDSISGSNLRRTSSGVRRQNQPGDQGHHTFGARCDNTTRHVHHLLWFVWLRNGCVSTSPMAERSGGTSSRWMD